MAQQTKLNTLAIVSLVLAIISVPALACFGCGGLVFGVAGVIVGAIGAVLGLLFGLSMLLIPSMTLLGPGIQELFENITGQLGVQ